MICFDECGPLELRPIHGTVWAQKRRPGRLRATYNRYSGTEQFLAFYDVHKDCLTGQIRKRKTVSDLMPVFKRLRLCYPKPRRLYVVMDNLSSHRNGKLQEYFGENNMEPVWTPTYASWLNAIEAHFGPLKRFTLQNSDDTSHKERRSRIYRYITWRNKQCGGNTSPLYKLRTIKLGWH